LQPQLEQLCEIISLAEVPAAYERLIAGQGKSLNTIIEISR